MKFYCIDQVFQIISKKFRKHSVSKLLLGTKRPIGPNSQQEGYPTNCFGKPVWYLTKWYPTNKMVHINIINIIINIVGPGIPAPCKGRKDA